MNPAGLIVLPARAIRARLHPWAIVALWSWTTLLALAVGWPAASLVGATLAGAPGGDAALWDRGGHALLDFLWHSARGVAPVAASAELVLAIAAVGGLLPLGATMFAMTRATRDGRVRLSASMAGAMGLMPSMVALLVVVGTTQAAVVALGVAVADGVSTLAGGALGDPRAQRLGIAMGIGFLGGASCLGVVHDLARAALVCSRARGLGAIPIAARVFASSPLALWWSWAWRALVSIVPVAAVALVAGRIGGRGGAALLLLAVLHQSVIAARSALRMSWLAHALRAVRDAD